MKHPISPKPIQTLVEEVHITEQNGNKDKHCRLTATCYSRLHIAWERLSTQHLKSVAVTDINYREINIGMAKCSKLEHDAATIVAKLPMPEPDELEQNIESLASMENRLEKCLKETVKTRG